MRVFLWKAQELSTLIVLLLDLRTCVPTEPTMHCQGPLDEPGRPRILPCGPGGSGPRSASCTDCHSIPNAVRASLTDQTSSKRVIISSVFGIFPIPYPSAPEHLVLGAYRGLGCSDPRGYGPRGSNSLCMLLWALHDPLTGLLSP